MTNQPGQFWLSICVCLTAAFSLAACNNVQNEGGFQFQVPEENLISKSDYPFFLAGWPDTDGFIFILNPEAPLQKHVSVVVSDREDVCANANETNAYVNTSACAPSSIDWRNGPLVRHGDASFWTYSVAAIPDDKPAIFVSCHAMSLEGHPGICTATLPFKSLVLSIGVDDDEVPNLDRVFDRTVTVLENWEVS